MSTLEHDDVRLAASELDDAAARSHAQNEIDSTLGYSRRDLDVLDDSRRDLTIALAAAFQYDSRHGLRVRDQSPFVPMFTLTDGTEIPPSPEKVTNRMAEAWAAVVELVEHPAPAARLSDLLFCRRWSSPGRHARRAVRSYLALSRLQDWEVLDKSGGLLRALDLSVLMRAEDLEREVRGQAFNLAIRALSDREGPGVTLPLLEELTKDPELSPSAYEALEQALSVYRDPHTQDHVLLLLRRHATSEEQRRGRDRARVEVWRSAAARAENPLVSMHYLEDAKRIANDYGMSTLSNEITVELQQIKKEDLGLTAIRSRLEISKQDHDAYLSQFVSNETLGQAVDALASHPPLTGSLDETRDAVARLEVEAPLQSLFSHERLGSDGLPRWRASDAQQEEDGNLADHEAIRLQLAAPLFADGLREIGRHYEVDVDDLREHLRGRGDLSTDIYDGLCDSLVLFWRGEHKLAVLVSVWLIEAAARELLLRADKAIYISQRAQRPGQYPGLGVLLRELQRIGLDESWFRYLWTVFASPAGLNLRNEIAHGFITSLSDFHSATVIHALNYLTSLSTTDDASSSSEQP